MINTEVNVKLLDGIYSAYADAETRMLEKVAGRVERGLKQPGWADRKAGEISALNRELKSTIKELKAEVGAIKPDIIQKAYRLGLVSANEDFGLKLPIDKRVPAKILRLAEEYEGILSKVDNTILRKSSDAFRQIQYEVSLGKLQGVDTQKQTAQRMLNKLADAGITGFVDKAGRNWSLTSYADMATRTVTAKAAVQGHIDRQREYGRDLVVISDHSDSCPICAPYQGVLLSLGGASGYTSYDQAVASGLFHPMCKHTLTGYVEGLTRIEPVEYDPEQYEITQEQRRNEHAIRGWKKREIVALDDVSRAKAGAKVREYQTRQRELLKNFKSEYGMTLPRKYDRERIGV